MLYIEYGHTNAVDYRAQSYIILASPNMHGIDYCFPTFVSKFVSCAIINRESNLLMSS